MNDSIFFMFWLKFLVFFNKKINLKKTLSNKIEIEKEEKYEGLINQKQI